MIIGIDASRANHQQRTGVEWYAYFVIEELKKLLGNHLTQPLLEGEEVKVVLYSDKPLEGELAVLPEGWESRVLRWPPKRLWTQLRMSYEMLVNPPDVLFIPAHVFPLIHPKKTIMTVHDIAAVQFPETYNWFERWYSTWSAKYAVEKLWKVITPSQFTKDELLKLEIGNQKLGEKIFVVHNGFDEGFFEKKNESEIENCLKKYSIQKPYLLSIGRLEEKKNTWRTIKAFDEIKTAYPNLQLVLVGNPGHGYEKIQQALNQSPYRKDIIFPGWVGKDDLPTLMQGSEMFMFPSLYEGFGIPVLEAMASGTAVVTSKGTSLDEVGGNAVVAVDPQSIESIAHGVQSLLENQSLQQEKIQAGFEQVKLFSWKKCAEETANILLKN